MDTSEKAKIRSSLLYPALFVSILWLIKVIEVLFQISFVKGGILPLKIQGLSGIITAPFIHADFAHLAANSLPLLVLGALLFYLYRDIALMITILIWLITGFWVWVVGRESYHIGASGLVYGLAFFLFFSGLFRKDTRLLAATFLIAFLYGSMVWGVFPDFFPEKNVSWESHLMGMLSGILLAFYYRHEGGPPRKLYSWELEESDDEDEMEAADFIPEDQPPRGTGSTTQSSTFSATPEINYIYTETKNNTSNSSNSESSTQSQL